MIDPDVSPVTGDLFAALLLARLNEFPQDLRRGIELATASLHEIVTKTFEHIQQSGEAGDSHAKVSLLVWCLQICQASWSRLNPQQCEFLKHRKTIWDMSISDSTA